MPRRDRQAVMAVMTAVLLTAAVVLARVGDGSGGWLFVGVVWLQTLTLPPVADRLRRRGERLVRWAAGLAPGWPWATCVTCGRRFRRQGRPWAANPWEEHCGRACCDVDLAIAVVGGGVTEGRADHE